MVDPCGSGGEGEVTIQFNLTSLDAGKELTLYLNTNNWPTGGINDFVQLYVNNTPHEAPFNLGGVNYMEKRFDLPANTFNE